MSAHRTNPIGQSSGGCEGLLDGLLVLFASSDRNCS